MLVSLKVQNFKVGGSHEFAFERISVLEGGIGGGRTLALDAIDLLASLSRDGGTAAVDLVWISEKEPTRLTVVFATCEFPELEYTVALRRVGGETHVLDELVTGGGRELLRRAQGRYRAGAASLDPRPIADTRLALADAVKYIVGDDPVHDVRKALQDAWLVSPDALRMGSAIGGGLVSSGDTRFVKLAAYIAFRSLTDSAVRAAMMESLSQLRTAAITGFSAKTGADGRPYLVVHHRNDLDSEGVPFGSLDNSEKMLFLAAFVCAMNEHALPLSVVWDSPTNWLGGKGGPAVVRMLRRSFARRGQLVLLA